MKHSPNFIDLTGQRFGRLIVIDFRHIEGKGHSKQSYWNCICDCGNKISARNGNLRNGNTKSCGCRRIEVTYKRSITHRLSNHRMYGIWEGMKSRCKNKRVKSFKTYGKIGINVEWKSFEEFYKDMIDSYDSHVIVYGIRQTTIDRIDPYGNYSKKNCRWATYKVQASNRRSNIISN